MLKLHILRVEICSVHLAHALSVAANCIQVIEAIQCPDHGLEHLHCAQSIGASHQ